MSKHLIHLIACFVFLAKCIRFYYRFLPFYKKGQMYGVSIRDQCVCGGGGERDKINDCGGLLMFINFPTLFCTWLIWACTKETRISWGILWRNLVNHVWFATRTQENLVCSMHLKMSITLWTNWNFQWVSQCEWIVR